MCMYLVYMCLCTYVHVCVCMHCIECSPVPLLPLLFAELFELFKEEFLQDGTVPAQNIARRLYDGRVIPQEKQTKIMNATCDYDAASILYGHMAAQATKESAKKLFNVMINTEAYQKMNDLGRRMLDALQKVSYLECTTSYIHNMYMHLYVYLVSVHIHIRSTHDAFLICTEFVRMYTFIYTSISYLSFLCFSFCTDPIEYQGDRDKNFTFFVLLLKNTIVRLN